MHAWPEDATLFGDLTLPPLNGQLPYCVHFLVLVCFTYFKDLLITLISRDSTGMRIGSRYFTDTKLIATGSLATRIWRFTVLVVSTTVFFMLYYGQWYDLDRLHVLLHGMRAVTALKRLFNFSDEIKQHLKVTVSQNKRRFIDRKLGIDLDLTYVCDRVVAMSLPCISDAPHRNDIQEVSRFFRTLHYGSFLVTNLCQHFEERGNGNYDCSALFNQVQKIPCVDHNAPTMQQLIGFVERATCWLNLNPENTLAVHCQGGKGRTGTFIVALLMWVGCFHNPSEAVKYVQNRRADYHLGHTYQGVSSPSQLRMIGYLTSVIYCATCHATLANALMNKITLRNFPRRISKGGALALVIESQGLVIYDHAMENGLLHEIDQVAFPELETRCPVTVTWRSELCMIMHGSHHVSRHSLGAHSLLLSVPQLCLPSIPSDLNSISGAADVNPS
jgi:hypothetical protein